MRVAISIAVLATVGAGAIAFAQSQQSAEGGHMDHSNHAHMSGANATVLLEPGQGAFAALSEIVRVLENDPNTDWSRVDLDGLRAHLVDMDRLVTGTVVSQEDLPNGFLAVATGDPETIATLRRMVPAHAAQLAREDRWSVTVSETANAVALQVTSDDPAVVARIQGLGFFGLMASQDHHREHHLMMALGKDPHEH